MLGSNVMTLARIATARRQIASNASQSRGRNWPSGDFVSRRPAAENFIGCSRRLDLGRPRLVQPEPSGTRAHARSVRPGSTLPDQAARSSLGFRSFGIAKPAQTGKGWSCTDPA